MVPVKDLNCTDTIRLLISESKPVDENTTSKIPFGLFSGKCIAFKVGDDWKLSTIYDKYIIVEDGNEVIGGMLERKINRKVLFCNSPTIVNQMNTIYRDHFKNSTQIDNSPD